MSKTEQIVKKEPQEKAETQKAEIPAQEDSEDIFEVSQINAHKYFESIEKAIPKYSQAIEALQKEDLRRAAPCE